jgi:hypothetical protein
VDWRREDWGYAAATLVAASFVAYLVAGNFGLVGTPFGRLDAGASPVTPAIAFGRRTPSTAVGVASPTPSSIGTPVATGRPQPSVDRSSPSADITSPGGTVVSVTQASKVTGTAQDEGSGVDKVTVTFDRGSGDSTTLPASLSCSDASRTSCTWSVDVPDLAGDYDVVAHAIDRSGNTTATEAKHVTVVNAGGTVEDLLPGDAVDDLLGLLGG